MKKKEEGNEQIHLTQFSIELSKLMVMIDQTMALQRQQRQQNKKKERNATK